MRAGILLMGLYWAPFTTRAALQREVAAEGKAATYAMNRDSGLEKRERPRGRN